MTKNRFKQICDYFYNMRDTCVKLMSDCDNVNDVNIIFDEYRNKLEGAYTVCYILSDYEYERSKLLSVYNDCSVLIRFNCLIYVNKLNDDNIILRIK